MFKAAHDEVKNLKSGNICRIPQGGSNINFFEDNKDSGQFVPIKILEDKLPESKKKDETKYLAQSRDDSDYIPNLVSSSNPADWETLKERII